MQAREKHSVQHVVETALGARIGAIEGKCPFFAAKPDHGAYFFITASSSVTSFGIFHSHDGHATASINATAGSPPRPFRETEVRP
jgi:hypothetical protein